MLVNHSYICTYSASRVALMIKNLPVGDRCGFHPWGDVANAQRRPGMVPTSALPPCGDLLQSPEGCVPLVPHSWKHHPVGCLHCVCPTGMVGFRRWSGMLAVRLLQAPGLPSLNHLCCHLCVPMSAPSTCPTHTGDSRGRLYFLGLCRW